HTSTMTEDYEFSARTALLGAKVDFAPEAIVYDEQPLHFAASWKQRRRWVTGSLQGLRLYGIPLLRAVILQHSFICFDMLLTFLAPVLGLVSMVFSLFGSTLFGLIPMLIIFAASAAFTVLGFYYDNTPPSIKWYVGCYGKLLAFFTKPNGYHHFVYYQKARQMGAYSSYQCCGA
ncbi:MAG: glycosyltransferase family 2 protein, partial [Oscillospiraceae bacterium]